MKPRSPNVKIALDQAFAAVDRFVSAPLPNETIVEVDLGSVKSAAAKAQEVLESSDDDDLIQDVNGILANLGFPEIEHQVASRGLLVVKLQGLELVNCLQEVRNQARIAGLRDPDAANLDITNSVSKEFLADINDSLKDVAQLTSKLQAQIKSNKQSGISIGFAGVSVDVGVAIDFLKQTTEDAREYIAAKTRLNAEALRSKLRKVSSVSVSLLDAIRSSTRNFGRKVADLTTRIAAAASASYGKSLELIKTNFSSTGFNKIDATEQGVSEVSYSINVTTTESTVQPSHSTAVKIFSEKLQTLLKTKKIPSSYLENGFLSKCTFFQSHNQYYVTFYFVSGPRAWRKKRDYEAPVSVTHGISKSDFIMLKSLGEVQQIAAAEEALNLVRTEDKL